ncbi:MAG: peptidoglycan-binding protein [Rhodobacteraceae bacterium]|nr:MAG: peptidoglycan-binding protein [Paracoccaceae bacterium]
MPKNIVVFSDGTGQVGGKTIDTNIYKLFKAIENRTQNQISFYDRGIGTEPRGRLGKVFTSARRAARQVTGWGFSKNVNDCYRFIFDNYEAGDKIYLFGFSRGAATVRSVAGFIHMFGILPKSRPELIKEAYNIYKNENGENRLDIASAFRKKHHTMWATVEFIGVWDTVAALFGKRDFHDFSLSPSVNNAYHALSIDDDRKKFHPILWDETLKDRQSMEQMWFCGVHTDVGGGYPETGLSDIALKWLLDHAISHGLLLYTDKSGKPNDILKFSGNPDGPIHDLRIKWWEKIAYKNKIERFWPELDSDGVKRSTPNIHPSVKARTHSKNNDLTAPYDPWILR